MYSFFLVAFVGQQICNEIDIKELYFDYWCKCYDKILLWLETDHNNMDMQER